ncbi:RNA-binding protein 39-like isoform X1 [Triticum dicoccoides]|uniref:RNA-binding protein 39-like isoform X1 n=2 Tax=Triticum dicoccoides TaxID=85692 RepID=UPI00188F9738|nr:RNA-binding protein 39-like isoform X1 [Triticum dicoccoides]
MDFDEYDYLEKAVEPSVPSTNGGGEKDRSSRRRSSTAGGGGRDQEERGSKRPRSGEDRERHRSGREHRDREDGKEKVDREKVREKDEGRDREKVREKDEGRDREKVREKDGGRSREKVREKDESRDPEKVREKEEGRDREKVREKDGSRDREKVREKEREGRDKLMERENGRERRSRSRSERRRGEEEEMVRELQRERERSDRHRDYRDRDFRRKKDDGTEPEVDPERDQRTVFAFQLSLKADERDVYEFFSRAGKVRDVRLIMDRNSRRSKGVGYIEFYDVMSVPMAIALTGQPLLGQAVMVKPSEAEKNLAQSNATSGGAASGGARKLYVGNLHSNITEDQLRQVFEPFGQVELVQLPVDPLTGLCKGFGFIQFARLEDAKAAQSLNGQLDIAGRVIKVSAVTDQGGVQLGTTTGDLDDDEGGGLALNASSRALLMRKLDRSGTATSLTGGIGAPGLNTSVGFPAAASVLGAPLTAASLLVQPVGAIPGAPLPIISQSADIGTPTEFLLLKNMFDPAVETDPDFDLDIRDDVQDECSKFGVVKHIFVDKHTAGFVYLHFDSATAAASAQRSLHGRWFAGKMITATFMTAQQYEMKFPDRAAME